MVEQQFAEGEVLAFGGVEVRLLPVGQVRGGDAEAQGRVLHAAGVAHLQTEGHALRAAVEGGELCAHIAEGKGEGKVAVRVEVVETQVERHGCRRIAAITGKDALDGGAAGPAVGEQVAVGAADDDVGGGKLSQHRALLVGLVLLAIVHRRGMKGRRMPLAKGFDILRAGPHRTVGIGHGRQPQTAVADRGIERRIEPAGPRAVLDQRDAGTAQSGHMRRQRHVEHTIGAGQFLTTRRQGRTQAGQQDNGRCLFHQYRKI